MSLTLVNPMHTAITRTYFEAIPTAVIRGRVHPRDLSQFVPAACGEVWSFIQAAGLSRPGRHVALYLDRLGNIEVGAEVAAPFTGNDRVHGSQLPAGWVVTTTHFGPYAELSAAHASLRQWSAANGGTLSDVCWEIYGHWEPSWNTDPAQIRTDVFHLESSS